MEEPEDTQYVHFGIYKRHLKLLNQINNENKSQALRTILDSIINGKEQATRKKILDNSIMFISFGFFFIILTTLTQNPYIYIISLIMAIFLITYGGIGGIQNALRRTQHTKQRK